MDRDIQPDITDQAVSQFESRAVWTARAAKRMIAAWQN
jgi:hypothetical protein